MTYIGKSPTGSGVRQRYVYTATGGETSLSGADDNSKTLKFTDGEYVDVHLNGIQLVQGTDYGVGTANTINGLAALAASDVVEITVYDVYNVAKINSEAIRHRWYFTASGGETSITTSDITGLSFPANAEIEVRLNGISLVQGTDFNTTTANTVGGLAALSSGNVVEIVYYEAFQLADVVSKAAGGTYNGDVTFNGNINAGTIKEATGTNTGITIDSSGRVLLPQVPCCHVKLTTSNSQDTSNPYTTTGANIKFDSIDLNQGSCYSASTGEFTCPVAGVYAVEVQFVSGNGTTTDHEIALLHNSTTIHRGYNSVDSQYVPLHAHALIDCAVNDTISVQLNQGQIFLNTNGNYSAFTVRLVG